MGVADGQLQSLQNAENRALWGLGRRGGHRAFLSLSPAGYALGGRATRRVLGWHSRSLLKEPPVAVTSNPYPNSQGRGRECVVAHNLWVGQKVTPALKCGRAAAPAAEADPAALGTNLVPMGLAGHQQQQLLLAPQLLPPVQQQYNTTTCLGLALLPSATTV
mgnify:CR=1 FL=1